MAKTAKISLGDHVAKLPAAVRPTVEAAIKVVKQAAPDAQEMTYQSQQPASASTMWKLARYSVAGHDVLGIGTFPRHSTIFFYRGRQLDDGSVSLQGTGKDSRSVTLRSPADAQQPAVKQLVRRAFDLARSQRG